MLGCSFNLRSPIDVARAGANEPRNTAASGQRTSRRGQRSLGLLRTAPVISDIPSNTPPHVSWCTVSVDGGVPQMLSADLAGMTAKMPSLAAALSRGMRILARCTSDGEARWQCEVE
jgi:hypothetical protein